MTIFYTFVVAFFASLMLIPPLMRLAYQRQIIDQPGERKVHDVSLPRIGGLAIFLAFLFSSFIFVEIDATLRGVYIGMFLILGVGLMDDLQGLTPYWKLAGQFVAAGFPVFFSHIRIESLGLNGLEAVPAWALSAFTLLVVVAITNAINLSDGLDGLAGGITLICLAAMGALAYRLYGFQGNASFLILLTALAGALVGFLKYNTYPATIFMGDTGSLFLGFSAITFSLYLLRKGNAQMTPAHVLLLFAVPVIDTIWVMGNRIVRGVSPFAADRNHLHHRLMDLGFSHKAVVTMIYALATVTAMLPIVLFEATASYLYLLFFILMTAMVLVLYLMGRPELKLGPGRGFRQPASFSSAILLTRISNHVHTVMKYLIMMILLVPAFFLPDIPREFGIIAIGFACLITFLVLSGGQWADDFLYFTIYFASAVVLMVNNFYPLQFTAGGQVYYLQFLYNGMFVLLAGLIAFEIFVARRVEVLLTTPLEFFILVIAFVVPMLPQEAIGPYNLGAVGIKSITLFLGYKVLLMKTIKKNRRTIVTLVASTLIIGVKSLLS